MWIHLWALINPHGRALLSGRSADGWAAGAASPAAHPVHLSLVVGARGPRDLRIPVLSLWSSSHSQTPQLAARPRHPRSCHSRSGRVLGVAVLLKAGRGRPRTPPPAGHRAGAGRLAQQAERWAACGGRGLEDRALRAQRPPAGPRPLLLPLELLGGPAVEGRCSGACHLVQTSAPTCELGDLATWAAALSLRCPRLQRAVRFLLLPGRAAHGTWATFLLASPTASARDRVPVPHVFPLRLPACGGADRRAGADGPGPPLWCQGH